MVALELLVKWHMQTSINSPLKFKVLFSGVELPGGLQIYTYKHVYVIHIYIIYIYHVIHLPVIQGNYLLEIRVALEKGFQIYQQKQHQNTSRLPGRSAR